MKDSRVAFMAKTTEEFMIIEMKLITQLNKL